MPSLEKSRIVVLHLTKFSDSGIVLHGIDSLYGRKSFLVRGLRSKRGAMASFHSLGILDAVSQAGPKSSMSVLREWNPSPQLHGIRGDMTKSAVAMFISEVLYRSFTNEMSDPQLFYWLCDMAVILDAEEESIANFPLWFLVSYTVRLGFMPAEAIEPAGLFSPEEAALFQTILKSSFRDSMAIPLSVSRRQAFARRMLKYLSHHLGANIDARSLDVLHAVFA